MLQRLAHFGQCEYLWSYRAQNLDSDCLNDGPQCKIEKQNTKKSEPGGSEYAPLSVSLARAVA